MVEILKAYNQRLRQFLKEADLVPPREVINGNIFEYVWDVEHKEEFQQLKDSGKYYIYSLVDDNGLTIVEGQQIVNRYGYLLARNYVPIEPIFLGF
jgi:hypothetical protein